MVTYISDVLSVLDMILVFRVGSRECDGIFVETSTVNV